MNVKKNMTVLAIATASLLLWAPIALAGTTCDDNGGQSPWICVEHPDFTPFLGTHYDLDFTTDPDNPSVVFYVGGEWTVWSQVSSTNTDPAPLSTISIDPTVSTHNFQVKIDRSGNPGATNVGAVNLNKPTGWTGHSSIIGGSICITTEDG